MTLNRLIAIVFLVMLSASAFAQDEDFTALGRPPVDLYRFEFTGGGARAEGMGKAYLGLSDDITAGSWNPAGLFELSSPTVALSYGSTRPRGTSNSGFTIYDPSSDHRGSINGISSFNFAAPLRVKGHAFVGSASYTKNFDEYQSLSVASEQVQTIVTILANGFPDTTFIPLLNDTRSDLDGGLVSINFALGTKIKENISVGLAMNIYTGEAIRTTNQATLVTGFIDPLTLQSLDFETSVQLIDSNSYSGFNVTLGTQYKTDKFGVGLVIRTPFSLSVSTGRSVYIVRELNGLPTIEGSDTLFYDGLLAKYEIPLTIASGLGYKLDEKTTLALDIEYRGFSGKKVQLRDELILEPGGENTEVFTDTIPDWNNSFSVRAGVEHRFDTDYGQIPIRFGGSFVPIIAPNYAAKEVAEGVIINPFDIDDFEKSTASSFTYSTGFGIHWEQIHLDWAYSYTRYTWGNWQGALFDNKNRDHHINFTFTGTF